MSDDLEPMGPVVPVVPVVPAPAEPAPDPVQLIQVDPPSTTRRAFLGAGLAVTGGIVGAACLAKLTPVLAGTAAPASPAPAGDGTAATPVEPVWDPASRQWAYVVDTAACIGCGLCVAACKEENEVPEEPEYTRTWIERHVVTTDGAIHVDSPDGGIHGFPPESTDPTAAGKAVESAYFMPRLCMQCDNSPCTGVCPVGATYRTEDGVILVDARRCIGCGYCVVACPYGARYLVPAGPEAPNDTPGVADKCTWCYHRISRGLEPACVEVCPVDARLFGDAANPDDPIHEALARAPQPYWPEYGTEPRVLYLGPVTEEA